MKTNSKDQISKTKQHQKSNDSNLRTIAKIAGADTNWYHGDALGSPRKMTNESGSVSWTGAYYPFGEMLSGEGNVHGFTGKELDSEMGLNYFCQR